jgi:hypothetical protein
LRTPAEGITAASPSSAIDEFEDNFDFNLNNSALAASSNPASGSNLGATNIDKSERKHSPISASKTIDLSTVINLHLIQYGISVIFSQRLPFKNFLQHMIKKGISNDIKVPGLYQLDLD